MKLKQKFGLELDVFERGLAISAVQTAIASAVSAGPGEPKTLENTAWARRRINQLRQLLGKLQSKRTRGTEGSKADPNRRPEVTATMSKSSAQRLPAALALQESGYRFAITAVFVHPALPGMEG